MTLYIVCVFVQCLYTSHAHSLVCAYRDQDVNVNRRQLYKSSFLSLPDADGAHEPSQEQLEGVCDVDRACVQ